MNRERTKGPEDWVYKKKKRLGSDSRKPLSWPSLTWSARTWGWKVESHYSPFCLVLVWCWNSSPALLLGGHTCTTFSGRMLDSRSRQFFTLGTCTCTLFTVVPVEKPNTDLFRISKGQAPHELTGNYMLYSYYIHFSPAYTADCAKQSIFIFWEYYIYSSAGFVILTFWMSVLTACGLISFLLTIACYIPEFGQPISY